VNAPEVAPAYGSALEPIGDRWSHSPLAILCIAATTLALALFHTRALPLIDRDEGRYAEAAREMLASGDWLVPRLFGVAYLEKPPLFYWLTAAAYRIAGIDELGARLVSALAAAAGVLAIGLLGRRCFGPRAGLLGATVLATSGLYFVLARVAITDMLFSVLIGTALTSFFLAASERRSFLPFWLLAAAATLTKGPVAPVLCGLTALAYLASAGRLGILRSGRFWLGLPAFLAIVLTWFALVEVRHPGFLGFYVYKEHMLRVAGDEHRQPLYWYAPWLLLGLLPWTPACIAALPAIRARVREASAAGDAARFAFAWVTVVFVFFSVPRGKLAPYILPLFPPLALLLGDALDRWLDGRVTIRAMPRAFATVGVGLLVAIAALPVALHFSPVRIPPATVILALVTAAAAGVAILGFSGARGAKPIAAIAGAMMVLECVTVMIAAPIVDYFTAKPVIDRLRERLGPGDEVALYGGYFPNVPFYLQRIPLYVFGNRELDFGISLEGPGSAVVGDLRQLLARVGARRLLIVLRTRERDLRDLKRMPGETRLLHRGRSSSLIEHRP